MNADEGEGPESKKRFLLEYEVEAHGCLPANFAEFKSKPNSQGTELWVRNLSVAPGTDRPLLTICVLLFGSDIHAVRDVGREELRDYLSLLAFATSMSFVTRRLLRIVDWSPGLRERDCLQFDWFPGADLPFDCVDASVLESVDALRMVSVDPLVRRALRWFAAGVSAEAADEQFQFFWLALELLAQLQKAVDPVNDLCAKCRSPLYCETCKSHPTHRPYPKQAIRSLFLKTLTSGGDILFEHANDARNALMHGELIEEVLAKRGTDKVKVVDALGHTAWKVFMEVFRRAVGAAGNGPARLNFLQTNIFVHQTVSFTSHLTVWSSDPDNPTLSELPRPTVTLEHRSDSQGDS